MTRNRPFKNLLLPATIVFIALGMTNAFAQSGTKNAPTASNNVVKIEKTFPLSKQQRDLMLRHLTSSYYISGAPQYTGININWDVDRFISIHWINFPTAMKSSTRVLVGDTISVPAGNYHQFRLRPYPDVVKNGKTVLPKGLYIGIENINVAEMRARWSGETVVSLKGPVPGDASRRLAKVVGVPEGIYLLVREAKSDTCNGPDRPEDAGKFCGAVWGDPAIILWVGAPRKPATTPVSTKPDGDEYEIEENSAGFQDKK